MSLMSRIAARTRLSPIELTVWAGYFIAAVILFIGMLMPLYVLQMAGDVEIMKVWYLSYRYVLEEEGDGVMVRRTVTVSCIGRLPSLILSLGLTVGLVFWMILRLRGEDPDMVGIRILFMILLFFPMNVIVSTEEASFRCMMVEMLSIADGAWESAVYPYEVLLSGGFFMLILGQLIAVLTLAFDKGMEIRRGVV